MEALKQLKPTLPGRIIINVLRQAAKSCVIKRKFQKAGLLIKQAVYLAKEMYDDNDHPKYSDVLIDYGFYLLNSDSIVNSVAVYKVNSETILFFSLSRFYLFYSFFSFQSALEIRKAIFSKYNLHVAIAHEDLAYALYVQEYSSGKFHFAR